MLVIIRIISKIRIANSHQNTNTLVTYKWQQIYQTKNSSKTTLTSWISMRIFNTLVRNWNPLLPREFLLLTSAAISTSITTFPINQPYRQFHLLKATPSSWISVCFYLTSLGYSSVNCWNTNLRRERTWSLRVLICISVRIGRKEYIK